MGAPGILGSSLREGNREASGFQGSSLGFWVAPRPVSASKTLPRRSVGLILDFVVYLVVAGRGGWRCGTKRRRIRKRALTDGGTMVHFQVSLDNNCPNAFTLLSRHSHHVARDNRRNLGR